MVHASGSPEPGDPVSLTGVVPAQPFRLMRYYLLATLVAFAAVAGTLYLLQRFEEAFFESVQRGQETFLAQAQADLLRRSEESARGNLMLVHEAGHLNLTRLMAKMLWSTDVAPFVAGAKAIAVDHCRAIAFRSDPGGNGQPTPRRACFAEVGRRIMALPGFEALDAKAYAAMRASTVFRIKVWDLRGITVYSSEHRQIGENGVDNAGWKAAINGQPASELIHRDRFSAFEGVVEDRDLISTYVPMQAVGGDEVVGVVQIISDVTPFLNQIAAASKEFVDITKSNEAAIRRTAHSNLRLLSSSSKRQLAIISGLLGLLFASTLLIVRIGQRIIDRRSIEQADAMLREQQRHREKMAALAAIAANLAHEVGNPLAIILGLAGELGDGRERKTEDVTVAARLVAEQVARVATMTRQIADFATLRSELPESIDVNLTVRAVCQFLSFDDRFGGTPIEFVPGHDLPGSTLIPDHLNELVMNVLLACVEGGPARRLWVRIRVETALRDQSVEIKVVRDCLPDALAPSQPPGLPGPRLAALRRRALNIGGELSWTESTITISLRPTASDLDYAPTNGPDRVAAKT